MKSETKEVIIQIRNIPNKRIQTIEKIIGKGKIISVLKNLINENFLPNEIGKMLNKDRHVINIWLKRYNLKTVKYQGNKKSLLLLTNNEEKHEVNHGRYEQINGIYYRTYYTYPRTEFAYVLGLILGDGHPDDRKMYICGGKINYMHLDTIYPIVKQVNLDLGNRSTRIYYYTKDDKVVDRNDPEVSVWRIYLYWSALSNLFRNKQILEKSLKLLFSNEELFRAFTAGLFDADGYYTNKSGKPERIGIEQSKKKLWFSLFINQLNKSFKIKMSERDREYEFNYKGKISKGISHNYMLEIERDNWIEFIESVTKKYANKPIHLARAKTFKEERLRIDNGKNSYRNRG